jgi:hypothetical protein
VRYDDETSNNYAGGGRPAVGRTAGGDEGRNSQSADAPKPIRNVSGKNQEKLVAKPEVKSSFATSENDGDFGEAERISGKLSGWRIEKNDNGYYRYRWQLKDETGKPDTYVTSTGNTGYRRGSKYLPRLQAIQELKSNGKRRKKRR